MVKNKYYSRKSPIKSGNSRRGKLIVLIVILVIVAGGAASAWALHKHRETASIKANDSHISAAQKNGKSTSSSQQSTNNDNPSVPGNQSDKSTSSSGATGSNQNLESPATYSTFTASHTLGLNGASQTTCVTTPGASCKVIFTNGGTTKSLDSQTTDSTGSAYWRTWTPKSVGLTPGEWTITLQASLNGAVKSAQDSIKLQVTK